MKHHDNGIKIWLDDNRAAPHGWVWAKNAKVAKIWLTGYPVSDMSLDYDLDNPPCKICDFKCGHLDEIGCKKKCSCHSDGNETGLDLLHWMGDNGIWPINKPIVHSANPVGAQEMKIYIERQYGAKIHRTT